MLLSRPESANEYVLHCLQNFMLDCAEPFNLVNSEMFQKFVNACLQCNVDNIVLPKKTAIATGIMK